MVTIEVMGRPIAVTDATPEQARALFADEDFRLGLLVIASPEDIFWEEGQTVTVRASEEAEVAAFDESLQDHEEDGINVLFLVPLDSAGGRTLH